MRTRPSAQHAPLRASFGRWALTLAVLLCVAGCAPTMVSTTHGYVLARTEDGMLAPLPDDDPLYDEFERTVLGDAFLRQLVDLFEHTTEAYVATGLRPPLRQTSGNYPIVVLDSASPGVLYDIALHLGDASVPVERALAVGRGNSLDLALARQSFAAASGPWLLELVGVRTQGLTDAPHSEPASPEAALVTGFALALDALHSGQELAHSPAQPLSRSDALRTPALCAAYLQRLLQQTGPYTPQRYMLWFMHYTGPELPLAKLLRVCQRLAQEDEVSMEALISYYAEVYPAERAATLALAEEVFGSEAPVP